MPENVKTCRSFPELVEELRSARKRGVRLLSAAPNPLLGQAVGFRLSDGTTYRLTLDKLKEFDKEVTDRPELHRPWGLISTTEGRIELYQTC